MSQCPPLVGARHLFKCHSKTLQRQLHRSFRRRLATAAERGLSNKDVDHSLITRVDEPQEDRERVVILGSGWAGYTLACSLDIKKYKPIVISPRSYFVFTPLLASTAVGTLEFRTALEPVRDRKSRVSFYQGWADAVDFKNKAVTVEEAVDDPLQTRALTVDRHAGQTAEQRLEELKSKKQKGKLFEVSYDKLVVTVGCYMQTFGVPGVKENALLLKDVGDARQIRNRLLVCFETAALPVTPLQMKKNLLNFIIVGGGPTGIEFASELHDIVVEDLAKTYPDLAQYCKISVYDVAPAVLSMFDTKLQEAAKRTFNREGITIKTSHHVEEIRRGVPSHQSGMDGLAQDPSCWTLKIKEEGEVAAGMIVWSTGLMMNPFVHDALGQPVELPTGSQKDGLEWKIQKHPKSGGVITNSQLRIMAEAINANGEKKHVPLKDVFALGDCAVMENAVYPATAQVASQKANWLAKRLNKGDIEQSSFTWRNLGIMAYIGNWNALLQTQGGSVSGRAAWLVWRGAYLTKSVSVRNKILIPIYWFINWIFGRDISRF